MKILCCKLWRIYRWKEASKLLSTSPHFLSCSTRFHLVLVSIQTEPNPTKLDQIERGSPINPSSYFTLNFNYFKLARLCSDRSAMLHNVYSHCRGLCNHICSDSVTSSSKIVDRPNERTDGRNIHTYRTSETVGRGQIQIQFEICLTW